MTTGKEVHATIDSIITRQIEALEELKAEEKIQEDADIEELLLDNIKKQFKLSLENLKKLFDEFIDNDKCTLQQALEFVPLFTVYGLINGAQLGIAQDEYYLIVDYYLEKYNLFEKGEK
jgi:hypothetical protein